MDTTMFVLGASDMVTSSGLSDVVSFFNTQSTNNEVSESLKNSALAFKIAMAAIMFIGAVSMAVWIGRIAVDILLIVTHGMGKMDKLANFGTGKAESYTSVGKYLTGNLLQIILVIVLVAFLMTGWLFRLIAIALSGFGMLANKAFNLDIGGGMSKLSAKSYQEGFEMMRVQEQKAVYDTELASLKAQADIMYQMASEGAEKSSSKFVNAQKTYSVHMGKLYVAGSKLETKAGSLNLNKSYFNQHLDSRVGCNKAFVDATVLGNYGKKSISCATIGSGKIN